MKFLASYIDPRIWPHHPILELVMADDLYSATKQMAELIAPTVQFKTKYNGEKGVIVFDGSEEFVLIREWPSL